MKRSRRDTDREASRTRVNIVPLIDVIFLLLAFFMLLTISMVLQEGIPVDLAKAGASESVESDNQIVLTIEEDGTLSWNKETINFDELDRRLSARAGGEKPPRVLVNADRGARHGRIIDVVDRVRAANLQKVVFTVEPTQ